MAVTTLQRSHDTQAERTQSPTLLTVLADRVEAAGQHAVRYGLVLVLLWIGGMKFTAYEAEAISGLVANSPFLAWVDGVLSEQQFAALLGTTEIVTAVLIAARPFSAKLTAIGSLLAVGTFLTTLSFLISTPGVVEGSLGFPALSVVPGQFLIKDFVLLGAALWSAGEALKASSPRSAPTNH